MTACLLYCATHIDPDEGIVLGDSFLGDGSPHLHALAQFTAGNLSIVIIFLTHGDGNGLKDLLAVLFSSLDINHMGAVLLLFDGIQGHAEHVVTAGQNNLHLGVGANQQTAVGIIHGNLGGKTTGSLSAAGGGGGNLGQSALNGAIHYVAGNPGGHTHLHLVNVVLCNADGNFQLVGVLDGGGNPVDGVAHGGIQGSYLAAGFRSQNTIFQFLLQLFQLIAFGCFVVGIQSIAPAGFCIFCGFQCLVIGHLCLFQCLLALLVLLGYSSKIHGVLCFHQLCGQPLVFLFCRIQRLLGGLNGGLSLVQLHLCGIHIGLQLGGILSLV